MAPGPVLVVLLSGSHLLGALVLQKILLCIFLEEEPGPCPKAALLSLDCPSLVSASPPFLDEQLFEPTLWNSGKLVKAEVNSLQTRNGEHKGFCAQESHMPCSVSVGSEQ